MSYLGSQLGLPITERVNQMILEGSPSTWHKPGVFDWNLEADDDVWQGPVNETDLIHSDPVDSVGLEDAIHMEFDFPDSNYTVGKCSAAHRRGSSFARSPTSSQQHQQDCMFDTLLWDQMAVDGHMKINKGGEDITQRTQLFVANESSVAVASYQPALLCTLISESQSLTHENESGMALNDDCITHLQYTAPRYIPRAGSSQRSDEKPKEERRYTCPAYGCVAVFSKRYDILRHIKEVHLPWFPRFKEMEWNTFSINGIAPNGNSRSTVIRKSRFRSLRCPQCAAFMEGSVCGYCAARLQVHCEQRLLV
jgi:hypothetical protein